MTSHRFMASAFIGVLLALMLGSPAVAAPRMVLFEEATNYG